MAVNPAPTSLKYRQRSFIAWGWQSVALIWAGVLAATAVVFWLMTKDDPVLVQKARYG